MRGAVSIALAYKQVCFCSKGIIVLFKIKFYSKMYE